MSPSEVPWDQRVRPKEKANAVSKLREHHHTIARMYAQGVPEREICRLCGTTFERLHRLACSPAFIELIASYKIAENTPALDTYASLVTRRMILSEVLLVEKLEDAANGKEEVKFRDLLAATGDGADRMGYMKGSLSVSGNAADFASALERASGRSAKVIESTAQDVSGISLPDSIAPPASVGAGEAEPNPPPQASSPPAASNPRPERPRATAVRKPNPPADDNFERRI